MHIAGSSALVTGGASGLGAGVVRHLVDLGAKVTIVDVNHQAGMALAQELGTQAQFVAADVADTEQMRSAVEAAAASGDLRILVCCAGIAAAERTLGKEGPLPLERFTRHVQRGTSGGGGHGRQRTQRRR